MMDPIADMLTRIRNASAVRKTEIVLPMSKIKFNIGKILEQEGWVGRVEVLKAGGQKNQTAAFDELRVQLKYKPDGQPMISTITRVSKPSLRIYVNKEELPRVLNNLGIAIISTSKGLMTNKQARKQGVGGEVVCEIY
ncbi:30S ribosomal protein S8 [Candidatus Falkowbacteria bacterium]|nr:30S ribosomal protein S8 [Candidatus Falkowbacteria bacterium]